MELLQLGGGYILADRLPQQRRMQLKKYGLGKFGKFTGGTWVFGVPDSNFFYILGLLVSSHVSGNIVLATLIFKEAGIEAGFWLTLWHRSIILGFGQTPGQVS